MKIYKYILPSIKGTHLLQLQEIQYLTVIKVVNDIPYLWAIVDPDTPATYKVNVYYTGDDIPAGEKVGTAVWPDGSYVLHYHIEKK